MLKNPEHEFEDIPFGIDLKEFKMYLYPLCETNGVLHCKNVSIYKTNNIIRVDIINPETPFNTTSYFFKNGILYSIKTKTVYKNNVNIQKTFYEYIEEFENKYDVSQLKIKNKFGIINNILLMESDFTEIKIYISDTKDSIEMSIKKLKYN